MAGIDEQDSSSLLKGSDEPVSSTLLKGVVKLKFDSLAKNPFEYQSPTYANTVSNLIPTKSRTEQIEAVLEVIDRARRENTPRGLVLNPSVVTADKPRQVKDMEKVKNILGKGNSAGEVYSVHDMNTGRDCALKKVLLIHFNKDEIRAWVHLADKGKAPELYSFHLEDNRVYIKMEILKGKTLKDIFVSEGFGQLMADKEKSEQKKCFSLLLLHGLLENFELLREGKFTHGDGHSGNIVVLPTLDVQLIDFGSAKGIRQGDGIDHTNKLKADVVNIIRQFCAAYSGVDFNEYCDALKALQEENFQDIKTRMTNIPESDRKWLFSVMLLVFDTVRDKRQEGFADTSKAASEVQAMLRSTKDLEDMKKKIAVLLFPGKYKNPHHDPEFVPEAEVNDEGNTLLDDPDLADLSTLVDLKRDFGDLSLF